jgi:hypothetical protein
MRDTGAKESFKILIGQPEAMGVRYTASSALTSPKALGRGTAATGQDDHAPEQDVLARGVIVG